MDELLSRDMIRIERQVEPGQQGTYFTIPFYVPDGVESITIEYDYARHDVEDDWNINPNFIARREINIIDLGLLAPDGSQVGASGSDKTVIFVSETDATPGYTPGRIQPGEWAILVGAYHVQPEGVKVCYDITLQYKSRRWLKGDLHTHTVGSDGAHTAEELAWKARRHGLDFVAITDHNQMSSAISLPRLPGVTLIPGVEWTHYRGHATFLGVDRPYDGAFAANTTEEIRQRFDSARQRGALITIAHPFEEGCGFSLGLDTLPFDCLEIWNGPMRVSNLQALGLWQSLLAAGRKIPASGGSDYHRDTPFIFLGGPTTWVEARSAGASDILEALRAGRAYIVFAPDGPTLQMNAGDAPLGATVPWPQVKELSFELQHLNPGDVVRLVTAGGSQTLWQAAAPGSLKMTVPVEAPGFARLEVLRSFLPGVPQLPALLSNPIYFDAA